MRSNHLCALCHHEMIEVAAKPDTDAGSNHTHWVTYYCQNDQYMETKREHRGRKISTTGEWTRFSTTKEAGDE